MNPALFGVIALATILGIFVCLFLGYAWHRWREARKQELLEEAEYSNLVRAKDIVHEIDELRALQRELKSAFKNDELDGGWRAALQHPLYLDAERAIEKLQEQLKILI